MNRLVYDTSQIGFKTVLTDWQLKTLQVAWDTPDGATSRVVWQNVNQVLGGGSISRASVINFLEDMRELGVLSGVEKTGKGGHHWVYSPKLDEGGFKAYIVERMITSLMENYQDATREAIQRLKL